MQFKIYKFLHNKFTIIALQIIIIISVINLFIDIGNLNKIINITTLIIFIIEYILNLYTSNIKYNSNFGYIKYIYSPKGIVDILAIIPNLLPFLFSIDLEILRVLRLFRILRIFKFIHHNKSLNKIIIVLKRKRDDLLLTLSFAILTIFIAAILIYFFEKDITNTKFTNFLDSIWWAVATFTTIGYGDIVPISIIGKLLSSIISILGIGIVALPAGIIASGIIEYKKENGE